jgi:hypothetical protein
LKDDEGVPLGGKRAAIQFAHNLKNEEQDGAASVTETSVSGKFQGRSTPFYNPMC